MSGLRASNLMPHALVLVPTVALVVAVACDGGAGQPSATPTPSPAASETPTSSLTPYSNAAYQIELAYPPAWTPDPQYANIGGGIDEAYSDPRGREYGYVQVDALNAEGQTLDDAAEGVASHKLKPYGENPVIEPLTVGGREARLILPDEASPELYDAVLIVPYESPVRIATLGSYNYLIVYAHKDFVRSLAETVTLAE